MSSEIPPLEQFNTTELIEIIRRHHGVVPRRSLSKERLIELVETGAKPSQEELAQTMQSRVRLQTFIEKNWVMVGSQLPCSGPNKGKCTIYPCPEARHIDCYTSAAPHII
jgi:hypothetical protein